MKVDQMTGISREPCRRDFWKCKAFKSKEIEDSFVGSPEGCSSTDPQEQLRPKGVPIPGPEMQVIEMSL
jgi:hypothetical protein